MTYRHIEQRPHQPDRVAVGTGASHLRVVVRQCRVRISLVQSQVRQHVAGVRDAADAASRHTDFREARQRARPVELAPVPRPPGCEPDGGGVERVVGIRQLDHPLRPTRRLVTDSQMHEFGQ